MYISSCQLRFQCLIIKRLSHRYFEKTKLKKAVLRHFIENGVRVSSHLLLLLSNELICHRLRAVNKESLDTSGNGVMNLWSIGCKTELTVLLTMFKRILDKCAKIYDFFTSMGGVN